MDRRRCKNVSDEVALSDDYRPPLVYGSPRARSRRARRPVPAPITKVDCRADLSRRIDRAAAKNMAESRELHRSASPVRDLLLLSIEFDYSTCPPVSVCVGLRARK